MQINEVILDTDYIPELSDIEIKSNKDNKDSITKFILVYATGNDPYTAIMEDNDENRKVVVDNDLSIIGSGETKLSIQELIYSLNHASRIQYKEAIANLVLFTNAMKKKFTEDDANFRQVLNETV